MKSSIFGNRAVVYCFAATVIMIMGVASVIPILPTLTRHFGVPSSDANLIMAFFAVPGLLSTPFAGIVADRYGTKRVLVPSLILFSVGGVASAFVPDFNSFLFCRFLQGMGSGALGVLALTIISDALEDGPLRVKALGYNNSIMSVGSATIPLVAGGLAQISWHLPLLLSGVALPLAFLIWFNMQTPKYTSSAPAQTMGQYLKSTGKAIIQRDTWYILVFTLINFMVMFGPLITFFPELADSRYQAIPFEIGLVMSASSVGTMLVASQISRILKHITARAAMLIGFILFGLGLLAMPFAPGLFWCIIPIFVIGLSLGINNPTMISVYLAYTPYEQRSGVLAVNSFLVRLAQTLGPLMFGFIYAGLNLEAVFIIGAGLCLLTCPLVVWGTSKNGPYGRFNQAESAEELIQSELIDQVELKIHEQQQKPGEQEKR